MNGPRDRHSPWVVDPADAAVEMSIDGGVSIADLWFLYEKHRLMAPASAWVLCSIHEEPYVFDVSAMHPRCRCLALASAGADLLSRRW